MALCGVRSLVGALRGVALRGVMLRGMHFWVGALKCVACWRAFLDVDVPYPWRFVAWHFVGGASWRGASWGGASLHGASWRDALGCHGSTHAFLDGQLPYRIRGPLMFPVRIWIQDSCCPVYGGLVDRGGGSPAAILFESGEKVTF